MIAARNESANIAGCVDSLAWADEILVADHGSADETVSLARAAGAEVVAGADAPTIGALRNIAIAQARNEWVLIVDADERGTAALGDAIANVLLAPQHTAYSVPRRNFFMGGEISHGGWERDRPVRLLRRSLRYDDRRVHERVVTGGSRGEIGSALLHFPYASLDQFFEKLDRYSAWWAADRAAQGVCTSAAGVVLRPPARFISMYVLRLGMLDGGRGAVLAAMAATSVMAKYARLWAVRCAS